MRAAARLSLLPLLLDGGASTPPFRVFDSFSVPSCYSSATQWPGRGQTQPFADASEAQRRYGITPRDRFEFVGWKCKPTHKITCRCACDFHSSSGFIDRVGGQTGTITTAFLTCSL